MAVTTISDLSQTEHHNGFINSNNTLKNFTSQQLKVCP